MMIDLKHKCKIYDRRVQQALIPFYIERVGYLGEQIRQLEDGDEIVGKDIALLTKLREELQHERAVEEKAIKDMANDIYQLWRDILQERKPTPENKDKVAFTTQQLVVHKGT